MKCQQTAKQIIPRALFNVQKQKKTVHILFTTMMLPFYRAALSKEVTYAK